MARKTIDMTSGPIFSKILIFVIPLLLTNLLQRLYNMADMLVVGRFAGSDSLAAVGAASAFTYLLIDILVNIAVGVSTVTAQSIGAKDNKSVHRAVHTAFAISLVGSCVIATAGIFFCRPVLIYMGTPDSIIDKAVLYMRIILAGYPINSLYNFGAAILRAKGDTKSPLAFLTIAGITNVLLNLIFVIGFNMTVEGVALATIISQFVSATLVIRTLIRETAPFKIEFDKIRFYSAELKRILLIGLPIVFQSMMFSISNMIFQSAVNSFGETAVAGAAASSNVDSVLYVTVTAPALAATIFTGQNIGAKKYDRVLKVMFYCMGVVLAMGIPACAIFYIFGKGFLGLYTEQSAVVEYGYKIMKVLTPSYFLCGIMEVISCCLKGMNKSFYSMISAISGLIGVRILWVFTYFAAHKDLSILYLSYPISWIFVIFVNVIMFWIFLKKLKIKNEINI